jgi:hypothetical protein
MRVSIFLNHLQEMSKPPSHAARFLATFSGAGAGADAAGAKSRSHGASPLTAIAAPAPVVNRRPVVGINWSAVSRNHSNAVGTVASTMAAAPPAAISRGRRRGVQLRKAAMYGDLDHFQMLVNNRGMSPDKINNDDLNIALINAASPHETKSADVAYAMVRTLLSLPEADGFGLRAIVPAVAAARNYNDNRLLELLVSFYREKELYKEIRPFDGNLPALELEIKNRPGLLSEHFMHLNLKGARNGKTRKYSKYAKEAVGQSREFILTSERAAEEVVRRAEEEEARRTAAEAAARRTAAEAAAIQAEAAAAEAARLRRLLDAAHALAAERRAATLRRLAAEKAEKEAKKAEEAAKRAADAEAAE